MAEEVYSPLAWFKWSTDDANILREALTETQVGVIFLAVMKAAETGVVDIDSVPPDLQITYRMYCQKVKSAAIAYANKCSTNRKNGAKGGRAKANNAREKSAEEVLRPKFKPPTKTEFKNMVKHIRAEYELDIDAYEIDRLYDNLAGNGWKFRSVSLTTRDQIEAVIYAKALDSYDYIKAVQLFIEKGYASLESDTIDDLLSAYDYDHEGWQIDKPSGPWYSTIEEAVDAYIKDCEADF